jgi:hypothetical protein
VVPNSADPVVVESVADGLKVSWRRPRLYADGTSLEDLGSFAVLRACAEEREFKLVATPEVSDRERFRKARTFTLVDHDVKPGETCRYRVIAETLDGYRSAPAESPMVTRATP